MYTQGFQLFKNAPMNTQLVVRPRAVPHFASATACRFLSPLTTCCRQVVIEILAVPINAEQKTLEPPRSVGWTACRVFTDDGYLRYSCVQLPLFEGARRPASRLLTTATRPAPVSLRVLKRLQAESHDKVMREELARQAPKNGPFDGLRLAEFASVFVRTVDEQRSHVANEPWCALRRVDPRQA